MSMETIVQEESTVAVAERACVPQCVGFIMDGNRRWAKSRGLPTLEGHRRGYGALKNMINVVHDAQISHMVCYAFSTENWKRAEEEVQYLMQLFEHAIINLTEEAKDNDRKINFRFIGERARFSATLQKEMARVEADAHDDPGLTVWLALSYGGRNEIVTAVNRAIAAGADVTEETFGEHLLTKGMPDPDLIIRTSGEERLSNFLLWQSAYSELFFVSTFWPDFGETEFQSILDQYGKRQRRIGK